MLANIATFLLVIFGLAGLVVCLRKLSRNRATGKWPTAPGRIIEAMVKTVGFGEDTRHRAEVVYEYEVGGRKHQNGCISFQDDLSDSNVTQKEADAIVKKYSVGESVKVFYNPSDARESLLEPKLNTTVYLAMVAFLILTAGTLWWRIAVFGRAELTPGQIRQELDEQRSRQAEKESDTEQ